MLREHWLFKDEDTQVIMLAGEVHHVHWDKTLLYAFVPPAEGVVSRCMTSSLVQSATKERCTICQVYGAARAQFFFYLLDMGACETRLSLGRKPLLEA